MRKPFLKFVVCVFQMSLVLSCKSNDFRGTSKKEAELPPLEGKSFQQITRETRVVSLKQGTRGAVSNESYGVTSKGVLDLLIVVDSSASMAEEQANLANRMTPLLSAVKDSDWQIAVTTTDPNDRCVTSLLQKNDWFVETRFKSAINAGIDGTGLERHFLRAVEGLKSDCLLGPGKWIRPNSTLAVLIVTDEDNCHIGSGGQGYGCVGLADLTPSYLLNYISGIRKLGTEARVYGLYWGPSTQCPTALKSADEISKVVTATGGTWGSICDADFSQTLSKISSDVAQILSADFTLKSVPDPGTLKLMVNGQPWTHFTLTGTVVHFTQPPPANSSIAVSYVSGAAGLVTNTFSLPTPPAEGSVTAKVGGAPAGPAVWDVTTQKVILQTTPPDGSVIEISYKENTPLQDSFEIVADANPGYIKVSVNGRLIAPSEYTYNGQTGVIKFKTPPPEGAKIDIAWRGNKRST